MVSGVNGALTLTAVKAVEVETKQEVDYVTMELHLAHTVLVFQKKDALAMTLVVQVSQNFNFHLDCSTSDKIKVDCV